MPRAGCCCRPTERAASRAPAPRRGVPRAQDPGRPAPPRRRAWPRSPRRATAVGDTMAIMVDLNQGWRMAGDTSPSLDPAAARRIAARLAELDVLWVEEPLAGTDLRGLSALRGAGPGIRIAGGEMTRTFAEELAALDADAFDVYQPDVVLAAGMLRTRTVAEVALARNRWFTPHTWTNGLGPAGQPARRGRRRRRPVHRVPLRPARLDPGAPGRVPRRADPARRRRRPARAGAARVSARSSTRPRSRGTPHDDPASTATLADWLERARPPSGRGTSCSSTGRSRRPPRAGPSTTSPVGTARSSRQVAEGGAEDVDRAVAAARRVLRRPPLVRPVARGPQAGAAPAGRADPREPRRAGAARVARRRQADPRHAGVDVPSAAKTIQWYAETIDKVYGEVGPTGPGALSLVTREPIGVVAAIVPWNYPLIITAWKLGAALATGNSVVLKPASQSPLTALRLAELAVEAGLPDGVLNVVTGPGAVIGDALARHPGVDKIAFTGSTEVGPLAAPRDRRDRRQGGLARARRQEPAGRAGRRRRRRGGRLGHRLGDLLQQRPDLQRRLAADRPPLGPRGARRAASRTLGPPSSRRASRSTRRPGWARWSTSASSTRCSATSTSAGRRAPRSSPAASACADGDRRLLRPADDPRRRLERLAGGARGDLRARPDGDRVRRRGRGAAPRQRHAVRAGGRDLDARPQPGAPAVARHPGRRGLGQHLRHRPTSRSRSAGTSSRASGATRGWPRSTATPSSRRPGSTCPASERTMSDDPTIEPTGDPVIDALLGQREAAAPERRRRTGGHAAAGERSRLPPQRPWAQPRLRYAPDRGRLGRRARVDPPRLAARARGDRDGLPRRRARGRCSSRRRRRPRGQRARPLRPRHGPRADPDRAVRRSRCTPRTRSTTS